MERREFCEESERWEYFSGWEEENAKKKIKYTLNVYFSHWGVFAKHPPMTRLAVGGFMQRKLQKSLPTGLIAIRDIQIHAELVRHGSGPSTPCDSKPIANFLGP